MTNNDPARLGKQEFGPKDQVDILLKEYDTLRTEILARSSGGYQLIGLSAGALAWLASRPLNWMLLIPGGVILLTLAGFFGVWARDTNACSLRVREIEKEINALVGRELLKWETKHGGGSARGVLRLFNRRANRTVAT